MSITSKQRSNMKRKKFRKRNQLHSAARFMENRLMANNPGGADDYRQYCIDYCRKHMDEILAIARMDKKKA